MDLKLILLQLDRPLSRSRRLIQECQQMFHYSLLPSLPALALLFLRCQRSGGVLFNL